MTKDEAIAKIIAVAGNALTADDVKGLDGCTQQQLEFIVTGWANVGKVRDEGAWSQIIDIMKQVAEWAPLAMKLGAAVAAVL